MKHISVQLIDDQVGKTLSAATDTEITSRAKSEKQNYKKTELAAEVGKLIAKKANERKITTCVFDKGANKYHGRVKALADKAREKGLKF